MTDCMPYVRISWATTWSLFSKSVKAALQTYKATIMFFIPPSVLYTDLKAAKRTAFWHQSGSACQLIKRFCGNCHNTFHMIKISCAAVKQQIGLGWEFIIRIPEIQSHRNTGKCRKLKSRCRDPFSPQFFSLPSPKALPVRKK